MKNNNFRSALIKQQYFINNSHYIKMLDEGDVDKQGRRNYLFIEVKYKNNRILVPLRTKLGEANRPFGVIGFKVPSKSKPLAGLDYRYSLVVNNENYIEMQEQIEIPNSQQKILENNYSVIENEVINYIEGYIACAIKKRETREPLYRESSLQNFNEELGVNEGRRLRAEELERKKGTSNKKNDKIIEKEVALDSNLK